LSVVIVCRICQTFYVPRPLVCLQAACLLTRASVKLSFVSWAHALQGVYFGAFGTPGVSFYGVFVFDAFRVLLNVSRWPSASSLKLNQG